MNHSPLRVAVLSDTHNRLPADLLPRFAEADEIWHLGDVCDARIIITLGRIAPLRVVRGNCDDETDWPLTLDFTIHGHRFHLEHIPAHLPPSCDFFLHGHTHVPRDEMHHGVRYLNPGCISRPKGTAPAYAWLTIEPSQIHWKSMMLTPSSFMGLR